MGRRSKRKGDLRDSSFAEFDNRRRGASRVFTVSTYLPRPVAIQARREIYTYPYPKQARRLGRAIRLSLVRRAKMVKAKVRIRIPLTLPLVRGSYVSLADGRLNIHSRNQLRRLLNAQEFNRRRYSEFKRNKRKASHGQLDSRGSLRFGSVAEAFRRGHSIDKIGDAALVARAITQSQRR